MFVRCLLLLLPCLSQAARPSASIYHLGTEDPCQQFGASQNLVSRLRGFFGQKGRKCRCKPGTKAGKDCGFSPPRSVFHTDEIRDRESCQCKDPCQQFGAEETERSAKERDSQKLYECRCKPGTTAGLDCGFSPRDVFWPYQVRYPESCQCQKDVCFNLGAETHSNSCSCPDMKIPNNDCGRRSVHPQNKDSRGDEKLFSHFYPVEAGFDESKCQCVDHPCRTTFGLYSYPVLKFGAYVCSCGSRWSSHECAAPGARYLELTESPRPRCGCKSKEDFARAEKVQVKVAALLFCQHAVEAVIAFVRGARQTAAYSYRDWKGANGPGAADLCQHVLTNSLNDTEKRDASWAAEAAEESQGAQSGGSDDTGRFGRMGPLVQDASPEDQELWRHSLGRVCHDECLELASLTMENLRNMAVWDPQKGISPTRSCAERVVRKVEADIMGCCGRTCGWNDKTCMSWPFLSKQDRLSWVVVKNSQCLKHVESIIHAKTHFSETSAVLEHVRVLCFRSC